jgi:hypothetical protein
MHLGLSICVRVFHLETSHLIPQRCRLLVVLLCRTRAERGGGRGRERGGRERGRGREGEVQGEGEGEEREREGVREGGRDQGRKMIGLIDGLICSEDLCHLFSRQKTGD